MDATNKQEATERILPQLIDTWQNHTIVYYQACEKKGKRLVDEVSICKLGSARHSRV